MDVKCPHGLDEQSCAHCRKVTDPLPLAPESVRRLTDGRFAVALGPSSDRKRVRVLVLVLESGPPHFEDVESAELNPMDEESIPPRCKVLALFYELALIQGRLFLPEYPLTNREQQAEGPSVCSKCRIRLSHKLGSLGCTQCKYYVCRCGRCVCGSSEYNYMRQFYSQNTTPDISRQDRLELLRVVRLYLRHPTTP